jgi:hypothetical protein
MTSDLEAAFEDYMRAFETLDLDRILPHFDEQAALVTAAGTVAMPDRDAIQRALGPMVEQSRSQNYDRSEMRNRNLKMLSLSLAQVTGVLVRLDRSGKEISHFGVVYAMRNADGDWKVAAITVHDAA